MTGFAQGTSHLRSRLALFCSIPLKRQCDVQGAPYAYTPFCDNNKEMEGFRFWKQCFWKDHLRGKPYHISALYVVDLARFRLSPHRNSACM